jgi:hypothetical protein
MAVARLREKLGDRGDEARVVLTVRGKGYLVKEATTSSGLPDVFVLSPDHQYLAHGDVVRIDPRRGGLTALYRRGSESNGFLVTERCDNYCVMCSQPPKE